MSTDTYVCPQCGCDSEDMEAIAVLGLSCDSVWRCPRCDILVADSALVAAKDMGSPDDL